MREKPWIYVAGPYSLGDPVQNTRRALWVADQLAGMGVVPIVPHLSLTWDLVFPKPPSFWYAYTLELLKRCDAIYRVPGKSRGADDEMAYAEQAGKVLITDEAELFKWATENGVVLHG